MEDIRSLFHMLNRKYNRLEKDCCRVEGSGISLVHSHILYEIDKQHTPSMQQIADTLGIDITTFSRQIQTLTKMGLVIKKTNPSDKRYYFLSLTEKGQQTADEVHRMIHSSLEEIFSQMNEFERDTVIHSLKILTRTMGQLNNSKVSQ
ncbi:MarR family winged helix-turn-helix transcriptional regulator [Fictibacillus phosphorivorans]|uniref:MarR family winged helix-turn-helix transcriptional regulator n=1 Tax=Fictibacillus phosphorivorans TaxID=1221500 RepID=UPI00203D2564|nr:MarR family winged helix-turn-helix transcriptional regulator [Fictibacillus phosphorivorans]MCM3717348.1 MarR family winged helix-turn-helix transcriptional regulator [Fictibacillus phosphorivorans]MCM3775043.1 MarR family winged helix-turn-helix transcriptional regulator [Fictibacillus phosphorivorans]